MPLHKFYIVYKTTNLINGKFYIGKHCSNVLNDDYLGSGDLLRMAIRKHGRENFVRENLFVFDSEGLMNAKEMELINVSVIRDPNCYNVSCGGQGGNLVLSEGHPLRETTIEKIKNSRSSPEWRAEQSKKICELHKSQKVGMYGKSHSPETKQLMSKNNPYSGGNKSPMSGRKHTQQTKDKMREAALRRKRENGRFVHH